MDKELIDCIKNLTEAVKEASTKIENGLLIMAESIDNLSEAMSDVEGNEEIGFPSTSSTLN